VRLLLGWREHAPYADGQSLVAAARGGCESLVQLLLDSPQPSRATFKGDPSLGWMIPQSGMPRSHVWETQAFVAAAERGHESVVRLLLEKTEAATGGGAARIRAAAAGHTNVRAIDVMRQQQQERYWSSYSDDHLRLMGLDRATVMGPSGG
jgi:hypothetical protein